MCPHGTAHWCHLANTIEPSVRGGDAVLCQITLTTCHLLQLHTMNTVQLKNFVYRVITEQQMGH